MHASCKQSHREIMFRFVFWETSISADSIEAKNFRLVKFRWSSFSCSQRPRKMKTISLDPDSALLWIAPHHCYTTLLSHFSSSSALLLIEKTSIFLWRRWVRFSSWNENLESINNCVMSVPMLAAFFVISLYFIQFFSFFTRFGIKREFHGWENFQCKDKQPSHCDWLSIEQWRKSSPACSRVNEKFICAQTMTFKLRRSLTAVAHCSAEAFFSRHSKSYRQTPFEFWFR